MLLSVVLTPGVNKAETKYSQKSLISGEAIIGGRCVDADKVRFFNRLPEKIGGWTRLLNTAFVGYVRGQHAWRDNEGNPWLAFGTEKKLYAVLKNIDELRDITPLRDSGSLGTDPFTTSNGSAQVTVNHDNHGVWEGDYVHFDGASAVNGITIDGEYTVTSVTDNKNYVITHTSSASGDGSGGGSSVTYEYEIHVGRVDAEEVGGFGVGGFGEGTWGSTRSTTKLMPARSWDLDNYGRILLAQQLDGDLYEWDPNAQSQGRATRVTNAPRKNKGMFVSPERMVVVVGAGGDPREVAWSDQNDRTIWEADEDNTAGCYILHGGNVCHGGAALQNELSIVLMDSTAYRMQFVTTNDVYIFREIGRHAGCIGPQAFASTLGRVFWHGEHDFFQYDGLQITRLPSRPIRDWWFDDLNRDQRSKFHVILNSQFSEVWFWRVSADATEIDSYLIYNFDDQVFTPGTMVRTGGLDQDVYDDPLWFHTDGYIYKHESGTDAVESSTSAIDAYIEAAPFDITNGAYKMDINSIWVDIDDQVLNVTLELLMRDKPRSTSVSHGPFTIEPNTDQVDLRNRSVSGRQCAFKLRSNVVTGHFRLGLLRLDVTRAGMRG